MDRTDIHGYDRNTYFIALALYKVEFEEIWCPEIINTIGPKAENSRWLQHGYNTNTIRRNHKCAITMML